MSYSELAAAARGNIGPFCKACPVCDGRACGSLMPGPGAKGRGRVAVRNYDAWDAFPLAMDPVHASFEASTRTKVLGHDLAPLGDYKVPALPEPNPTPLPGGMTDVRRMLGATETTGEAAAPRGSRVGELEEEVRRLRQQLEWLTAEFEAFRKQFQ